MNEQDGSHQYCNTAFVQSMLRGEIAAVESYNLAIRSLCDEEMRAELERIRDEHQSAACSLRRWARNLHEIPVLGSGAWGFFAIALTGLAALAGDQALLSALCRGERHGEACFRAGMGDPDLPDDFRHVIGAELLPQCQGRLHSLERIAAAGRSAASKS